jgi:thioesterase domain-containing protein
MLMPDKPASGPDLDLIVPFRAEGSRTPLFCVHAVSGSAYSYAGLAALLPDDQPVYGFEAPGFDTDRAPVSSLPRLADEYMATLYAFAPGQEYRLLGWSLGGLLAFEMAKRLHAAGARVSRLIMVDAGLPVVMPLPPERDILLRFLRDMMGMSEESPPQLKALYDGWPEHADPAAVFADMERTRILPDEMDAELLGAQYTVFKGLLKGFYSIGVGGLYHGHALHILAEESPRHEMDWSGVLPGIREVTVPGTHYTIWSGESLRTMSEIVKAAMDGD